MFISKLHVDFEFFLKNPAKTPRFAISSLLAILNPIFVLFSNFEPQAFSFYLPPPCISPFSVPNPKSARAKCACISKSNQPETKMTTFDFLFLPRNIAVPHEKRLFELEFMGKFQAEERIEKLRPNLRKVFRF